MYYIWRMFFYLVLHWHGPQNFLFYLISFFKFSKHRYPPSLGGRQWRLQVPTTWVEEEARHPRSRLYGTSVKPTALPKLLCSNPCAPTFSVTKAVAGQGQESWWIFVIFFLMIPCWIEKKYYVKHHPLSYESPLCPDDSSMVFIFFGNTLKSFVNNKS